VAESSDLTPMEWLARLGPQLLARQEDVRYWRRYYDGDHDLPSGPSQVADAFRKFQRLARTNLCGLAVRSMVDRMAVIGYRDASGADEDVWALWRDVRMQSRQFGIYRKALSRSSAYVVVGPDPRRPESPRVTIEGPEHVIVEHDPADSTRRLAALRLWHDPLARQWLATVYLPGWRYMFATDARGSSINGDDVVGADLGYGSLRFTPQTWRSRGKPERSTQDIPVVSFDNADEGDPPRAVFAGEGIDIQNRLNLTVLNRLTAERFSAFRQRALLNFVPEEDPVTGLPVPPFNAGADQTWTIPPPDQPGDPETKLIDLAQTDTSNMLRACEADMRSFAAATVTPVTYLPGGDMINIGQDAIQALDAGHFAKVSQLAAMWSGPMADVLQLMCDIAGLDRRITPSAIAWARPDNFHPAAVADYMTKLKSAGVPLPMICEEVGWSPERVEQLRAESAAQSFLTAAAN
jgi:hypothetical protein